MCYSFPRLGYCSRALKSLPTLLLPGPGATCFHTRTKAKKPGLFYRDTSSPSTPQQKQRTEPYELPPHHTEEHHIFRGFLSAGWRKANRGRCPHQRASHGPEAPGRPPKARCHRGRGSQLSPISFGSPGDVAFPQAASEVACEAFVLGSREISASVAANKACINSGPASGARGTKPNTVSQPSDKRKTNGAGIFQNRIIRSMSLHTFTYLRGYSRPFSREPSIEMDRTTSLWQHLH